MAKKEEEGQARSLGGVWSVAKVKLGQAVVWGGGGGRAFVGTEIHGKSGGGEAECRTCAAGNITMRSAADVSVCPKNRLGNYPRLKAKETSVFNVCDGANILGSEEVPFFEFQASDAKKSLTAVCRIASKGNVVSCGLETTDNYAQNLLTSHSRVATIAW